MNICVIGGGNMGTLISAELSLSKEHNVRLLASKAHLFSNEIIIDDWDDYSRKTAHIHLITADKEKALKGAELVLITYPANIIHKLIFDIIKYIDYNSIIGFIPGTGGVEFCFNQLIDKSCTIFGLQRVHTVTRIKEYGNIVMSQGKRKMLDVAAIPKNSIPMVKNLVENLFNIPCATYDDYLNITLTPSNPILHTTRLYSIFRDYKEGDYYKENCFFYKEWDDFSSNILIACDKEVQDICIAMPEFDLTGVKSLLTHYGVGNHKEMTYKISNIPAFQNILTPMIKICDEKYIPDKNNRYFTNDFPYGLCIIKGFAEILKVKTPNIDKVLRWYEKFANVEYFVDGEFSGEDLKHTGIPQNHGITTREEIIEFYK